MNHPVGVQLRRYVKIENRAPRVWLPGVDHLAGEPANVRAVRIEDIDALGIGSHVSGFGMGVVDVELHAAVHHAPEGKVHGVIGTIARGPPSPERSELGHKEIVRRGAGAWLGRPASIRAALLNQSLASPMLLRLNS